MAKRVFFSFHYDDVISFRANVVRNNWVLKQRDVAGFFDNSIWEKTKSTGDESLKNLIHGGLANSSVTAVLIGSDTYSRPWVRYEIFRSVYKSNRVIGIHINKIPDKEKAVKKQGPNPFDFIGLKYSEDGTTTTPYEYKGAAWIPFTKHPPYKLATPALAANRGKIIPFSTFYKTYDWVDDKGNENMATWVDA